MTGSATVGLALALVFFGWTDADAAVVVVVIVSGAGAATTTTSGVCCCKITCSGCFVVSVNTFGIESFFGFFSLIASWLAVKASGWDIIVSVFLGSGSLAGTFTLAEGWTTVGFSSIWFFFCFLSLTVIHSPLLSSSLLFVNWTFSSCSNFFSCCFTSDFLATCCFWLFNSAFFTFFLKV